jgi:hypothetical protein
LIAGPRLKFDIYEGSRRSGPAPPRDRPAAGARGAAPADRAAGRRLYVLDLGNAVIQADVRIDLAS